MDNADVQVLKYNSEVLMSMANYLRNVSNNSFLLRINSILGSLESAWQGPAADAFAEKVRNLTKRLQDNKTQQYYLLSNRLGQAATDLERATATIISGINKF